MSRILDTQLPLTVLMAPTGFGKTTLLADCCRHLTAEGRTGLWLSVEEGGGPELLLDCLVRCFGQAGVGVEQTSAEAAASPVRRVQQMLAAAESLAAPRVLAIDELERMTDTRCVGIVNALLDYRPSNLRLAFGCRQFPPGLHVAPSVLDGQARVLTAHDLRFSRAEIARILGDTISELELDALGAESNGWPLALRVHWYERRGGVSGGDARDYGLRWLESRMWRAMPEADQDLLLDAAIVEPLDRELLEEVLDGSGLWQRLRNMPALAGLLVPGRERDGTVHLHPLLREHCAQRLRRESPARFREVHRRVARARARRGEVVPAMRHATAADDGQLVAATLEQAGGVRLWVRDGISPLREADRLLTPTLLEHHPRLVLARCGVLILTGRLDEAARLFADVAARTDDFGEGGTPEQIHELALDALYVRALNALYGAAPLRSPETQDIVTQIRQIVDASAGDPVDHGPVDARKLDPMLRGRFEYALLLYHSMRAEFSDASDRAARSWSALGGEWSFNSVFVHYQRGVIAMAQGRVDAAAAWYARGRLSADKHFAGNAVARATDDVLVHELAVERNQFPVPARAEEVPAALPGAPFQVYAAGSGTALDLIVARHGFERALDFLGEVIEQSHRAELPTTCRFLTALQAGTLADAGRVGEAQRTWRVYDLPEKDAACVDLEVQTWREMEAVACARIRLLRAEESFDAAQDLARALAETARTRGLRRTLMRCLGLSMAVASAARDRGAADRSLQEFLDLFKETDYVRPLVREPASTLPVLEDHLAHGPEAARAAVETLVEHVRGAGSEASSGPRLTAREMDVLRRLTDLSDKEIAAVLGISYRGVRYYVGKLFTKLDARNRFDAVHRARRLGVLPD